MRACFWALVVLTSPALAQESLFNREGYRIAHYRTPAARGRHADRAHRRRPAAAGS
jgi:hypothetical protein